MLFEKDLKFATNNMQNSTKNIIILENDLINFFEESESFSKGTIIICFRDLSVLNSSVMDYFTRV